jgi:hypothetical protein
MIDDVVARHPSRTCSPNRVLTIRDMLSHVRRRGGHLTLRGVTISVGGRLVTLALALLVSRQGFLQAASRAHEVSGEVHAHSRCRAGHREQECALPLCVARMWVGITL